MKAQQDDLVKVFEDFIGGQKVLIADTNAAARATLCKLLIEMGIKTAQLVLTSSYPKAEAEIETSRPKLVICDFDLGSRSGLDLLQKQRAKFPDSKDSLFVLATGNNSQSAVARAAEEDVDCFILKPFSSITFRSSILKAVVLKVQPPEYLKVIDRGKTYLTSGQLDEAIKSFEFAAGLDPSPSLACYYLGQANFVKKALEPAEGGYRSGLNYNKIHYRCMVGLYEVLAARKLSKDAYEVIKRISQYFPANPKRLAEVLRLAVVTESYDDIEKYYQLFIQIDDRNEEIVRYICAALVVCGKYYLRKGLQSRALELFQKAAVSAAGRTNILREIIMALVEYGLLKFADEYLGRFPPDTQSGKDYLTMKLLIAHNSTPALRVVDTGRDILKMGIQDPLVYQILISRTGEAGLNASVQDLVNKAAALWPEKKDFFQKLAEDAAKKGAQSAVKTEK